MSKESAEKFLKELDSNEKALARLKELGSLTGEGEELREAAAIARETGYDVSAEELEELLKDMKKTVAKTSDKAADGVEKLNPEDLDRMAGGGDHDKCEETYKDNENCPYHDRCAKLLNMYYEGEPQNCDAYTFCTSYGLGLNCKKIDFVL